MLHKILYIQGVTRMGGAIESLLLLVKNLDKKKFSSAVVTSAKGPFSVEMEKAGLSFEVVKMEMWRKAKGFFSRPSTIGKLISFAKKENVSLIHCNTLWDNPYGHKIAESLGIPLVCHIRNTFSEDKIRKYKVLKAQKIICVSRAVAQGFADWDKDEKIQVIYNGVEMSEFDADKYDRGLVRRDFSVGKTVPVIGLVGRVSPEKGQLEMIKASALLKKEIPEFKVFIVGETSKKEMEYMAFLKNEASKLGVSENLIFTGFRRDVAAITSIFDIAVFPSLEGANEGFGRGIIEAMAMKKPVIGTDTGGITEVIENGESGLIINPGDSDMLAQNILKLLKDSQLSRQFSEKGYDRVREKFSAESYAAGIENIYSELLE